MDTTIKKYKALYGGGEIEYDGGALSFPHWAVRLFMDMSGVRSKKRRIQKKVLRRMVSAAIVAGAKALG